MIPASSTAQNLCKFCLSESWITATLSKLETMLKDCSTGSGPDNTYPNLELTAVGPS